MNVQHPDITRRKKIVQDDKDYTSAKISELARFIGFGLASLTLFFLTSSSPFAQKVMASFRIPILLISAVGCLIILCDYLQYYLGYRASLRAYQNIERTDEKNNYVDLFDHNSFSTRGRQWLFAVKHYFAVFGALALIAILIIAVFKT